MATGGTHVEGQSTVYQRLWNPTVARFEEGVAVLEGHPGGRGLRHRHGGPQRGAARRRRHRQEARRGGAAAVRRQRLPARLGRARQRRHLHHAGGRPRRAPPRHRPGDPGDAGQPEPGARRHRPPWPPPRTACRSWSTTPSPARSSSSPSGTAPRWCCTAPPSSSADTATPWAAWWPRLRMGHAAAPDPGRHRRHPDPVAGLPAPPRAGDACRSGCAPSRPAPQKVAVALAGHGLVRRVYYPGLPECDPRGLDRHADVRARLAAGLRGGQRRARRTDPRPPSA